MSDNDAMSNLKIIDLSKHEKVNDNILILTTWNTGETIWEKLEDLRTHDLPRLIRYAEDNDLADSPGWSWVSRSKRALARQSRTLRRLLSLPKSQTTCRRINNKPRRKKYNVEIPRNPNDAILLDNVNKNKLWKNAITKELNTLTKYGVFKKSKLPKKPKGYKWIPLHFVFDVKHDGTRKARLVAGGNVISTPDCSLYASVVKTENVRALLTVAAHLNLEVMTGDVSGAYLNAKAEEKVCSNALDNNGVRTHEFVIIEGNLYGLRSAASAWWTHFAGTLRSLGFRNAYADSNVWFKARLLQDGTIEGYDYIVVHVDDFMIMAKNAEQYMSKLKAIYNIRHITPVNDSSSLYLGMDIRRMPHGKKGFLLGASTYLQQALSTAKDIFDPNGNFDFRMRNTVLRKDLNMDSGELLDEEYHTKYMRLVGILNWISELGRLDITFATRLLSRQSAAPRTTHWEALKHVFGYLKKHTSYSLPVDSQPIIAEPGVPIEVKNYDKELEMFQSLYPHAAEEVDPNAPFGIYTGIDLKVYVDATWASEIDRRSVTGYIVYFGSTPITWYSGVQSQIEGSTYASEFCALRKVIEVLRGIRYALRSLGIVIQDPTIIYCDNRSVCSNAELANSFLKKRHVGIAYHMCREAVAAKIARVKHITSSCNRADILTKILGSHLLYKHCERIFPKVNRKVT